MGINPVTQSNPAAETATTGKASGLTLPVPSASGTKKDTVLISQKARDLAAMKAGRAMQEEATESMSAKLQEASGS